MSDRPDVSSFEAKVARLQRYAKLRWSLDTSSVLSGKEENIWSWKLLFGTELNSPAKEFIILTEKKAIRYTIHENSAIVRLLKIVRGKV